PLLPRGISAVSSGSPFMTNSPCSRTERRVKPSMVGALLLVTLLLSALVMSQDASSSRRPVFFGRELAALDSEQRKEVFKLHPASRGNRLDPALEAAYEQVAPEKSLVLHDCSLSGNVYWCLDPEFSFARILRKAADVAKMPVRKAFDQWLTQ